MSHDLLGCTCKGDGSQPRYTIKTEGVTHASTTCGFVTASRLARENLYEQTRQQKLAHQLGGFLHFDFYEHANKFGYDSVLQNLEPFHYPADYYTGTRFNQKLSVIKLDASLSDHDVLEGLVNKHMNLTETQTNTSKGGLSYVFVKPSPISHLSESTQSNDTNVEEKCQ